MGEVEATLLEHGAVESCVVVARGDDGDDRRLVAYLVPRPGEAPAANDLRAHLKRMLPDYMVPSAFVTLERMPLLPSGKIDRRALPEPRFGASDVAHRAPGTPLEELVAGAF